MTEGTKQAVRVKESSRHRQGVKSKASTKLTEKTAKHCDRWDLVKELMAGAHEVK
jgi:hypothetical protein